MPELPLYLLLVIVATAVVWWGSDLLEKNAQGLSNYYGLPPVVHGAVVVAVGSSFPELSSTVLSTLLHGEFELGLSVVIGSAIFNILVIPGLSGWYAQGTLKADKELVYKDAQFYIISVAVLMVAFSLAVIYFPVEGQRLVGTMNRGIALLPFLMYGLYLFIQRQEVHDQREERQRPDEKPWKLWLKLLLSLVLIVVGVEGLVRAALFFGEYFGTPSFVWGILVIATVTSLPDVLISLRLARKGQGVPSLSNVLGSNIFDLLVAVPAGVLIAGATPVNFQVAMPLMTFLTLATVLLFTLLRIDLDLNRRESTILLLTYALFTAWIILEALEVVDWVGEGVQTL